MGTTGSGKTFLSKQLVRNCPRLLVIDPLCEWADKCAIADNWETVLELVRRDRFRISIQIDETPEEILDFACSIAMADDVGNCTLVVDELSLFFRRGSEAPDSIQRVVRFGRRQNINLILISQRSYDCPIDIRSLLTDIYAFRSHEPNDIKYLAGIVGREEAQRVVALRGHRHYHWNLTSETPPEALIPEVTEDSDDDSREELEEETE